MSFFFSIRNDLIKSSLREITIIRELFMRSYYSTLISSTLKGCAGALPDPKTTAGLLQISFQSSRDSFTQLSGQYIRMTS